MAKLYPYLHSEDARAQAEFYTEALGGEILSVMTYGEMPGAKDDSLKDKVLHLALVAAGVKIFMSDSFRPVHPGTNLNLSLEFADEEEARMAFANLAEGGTIGHPLETAFWGTLFGQVTDKYGVLWMITTEASHAG